MLQNSVARSGTGSDVAAYQSQISPFKVDQCVCGIRTSPFATSQVDPPESAFGSKPDHICSHRFLRLLTCCGHWGGKHPRQRRICTSATRTLHLRTTKLRL